MTQLHAQISAKLVDIENLLARAGFHEPSVTLFARDPQNDSRTIILSTEKSPEETRASFEIVMRSANNKVEATETDLLRAMVLIGEDE